MNEILINMLTDINYGSVSLLAFIFVNKIILH